ncbi:MAG: Uma2 family endonuclease, partial [Chloroflexota bacterium]
MEITSQETRQSDLEAKVLDYAAIGIKEYLIIDIRTIK